MGYQTEADIVTTRHQDLFLLDKHLKQSDDDAKEILNKIPGIIHLNHKENFKLEFVNREWREYTKVECDRTELAEKGMLFVKKFCHEKTFKEIVPEIEKFYSADNEKRVFGYFQKVWNESKNIWDTWLSVKKPFGDTETYITFSTTVGNFGSSAEKLSRIVGEQRFARENYLKFQSLTPREIEILTLLAKGNNNPEIAEKLFISRYTVEQHRKNLNRKLEINSYVDIVKYAHAFDLITY